MTSSATWSEDLNNDTVSLSGSSTKVVTANNSGTENITASHAGDLVRLIFRVTNQQLTICENSCNGGTAVNSSLLLSRGDTKNLKACYNTNGDCVSGGDVTSSATWSEDLTNNTVSLSGSNPKVLSADNRGGPEMISASYLSASDSVNVTVSCPNSYKVCNSSNACVLQLCTKSDCSCTDECSNNRDCSDVNINTWKEVTP